MMEIVKVENYMGDDTEVLVDYVDAIHGSHILVEFPLNNGFVVLFEREKFGRDVAPLHDPRPWIVCFMRRNSDYPKNILGAEFSDITFHPRIGGQCGALTRMGEMIESCTGGRY